MSPRHCISILITVGFLGVLAASVVHAAENRVVIAGDGPDIVLIPGLASDGAALQPLAEHLAACHRTHTFTLAGFAGQPSSTVSGGESRMTRWETQIADYLQTLPSHRAVVIGHSLGGVLAMKLAIDHPERVERLVILDSLPFFAAVLMPGVMAESVKPRAAAIRDMINAQSIDAFRAAQDQALRTMTMKPDAVPILVDSNFQSKYESERGRILKVQAADFDRLEKDLNNLALASLRR